MTHAARASAKPYAVASAVACVVGLACALLLREPSRTAAVYAAVAASVSALCGLSALVAFAGRGTQGVLLGFTIGFLCRAVLIAVGLVASGARGSLALVYVACFFAVYAATQVIEILFVAKSARVGVPGDAR